MVDARESELVHRARMGLELAYAELLTPLLPEAARLAYGLLQDRCAAEDAVQEAALLGWQRLANLQPGRSFRPWFLGIVGNRCREVRRSRWRFVTHLSDQHPSAESDWLVGEDLRRALAELPHNLRVAIVLHFYVGLPLEEVASTLGLGISGVKSRINRGLRRLRRTMQVVRP